jgi:uncharacterized protein YcnI
MSLRTTIAFATATAALAVPATAGAHATVTPMQPQGNALTSARTLYVLRVPNETAKTDTFRVRLYVPAAVQESIALKRKPGWAMSYTTRDTGKKDQDGAPVLAISRVTWTAKPGSEISPHFFDDFELRFQNPATPQTACFPIHQTYGTTTKRKSKRGRTVFTRKVTETVKWTGPETSATPASCLSFVSA